MPYAVKDAQGRIASLHRHDPGVGEWLPDGHPEVLAFVGLGQGDAGADLRANAAMAPEPADDFNRLDADFIRVLEDVIDALLDRNLITITDLPDIAQTKLFARKSYRERRPKNALDLFKASDLGEPLL